MLFPISLVFVILSPVSLNLLARIPQNPQPQSGQQFEIQKNVELVVLRMSVRDSQGTLVSGLKQHDFQVFEDKVSQEIETFSQEDIPVVVGLVVDNSASMRTKRADVITAALAFAQSSNMQDQMFVINFNETVSFGLPPELPFTDQADRLRAALLRSSPDGRTALYDATSYALEHLRKGDRDRRALIIVSDGGDNASNHTLAQIRAAAIHSDAIIYTIGLFDRDDPDRNPRVLKDLAKTTGGEAFFPDSSQDVVPICQQIAQDIRHQYTIAYVPTNTKQDGTYRSIEVKAHAPGHGKLSVRTRTGYYAPLDHQASASIGAIHHDAPH